MTYFYLSAIFTSILSFFLGAFSLYKSRKSIVNRIFFLLSFCVSIWTFGLSKMVSANEELSALFWVKYLHIGVFLIPSIFFHFICALLNIQDKQKYLIKVGYLLSFLFIILNLSSNLLIANVKPKFPFQYYASSGLLYPVFLIMFFVFAGYGIYLCYRSMKNLSDVKKNQVKYVFVASLVGFIGGVDTFLPMFNIPTIYFGISFEPIYILILAYAITRYRLMDIKVALTRTGIFIVIYTLILGLPFLLASNLAWRNKLVALFGSRWWTVPLGLMAVLATLGPFIYIYVNRKAEERLLREQKRYQDVLKQASLGMTRIRNLKKLLNLITHIVTKTVKISYVGIYLYNQETDEYVLQVSRDKGRMPIPKLTPDNPLISWIAFKREPLVYEEIKRQMQDFSDPIYKHLEENMRLLTASVLLPSFLEDRFIGFIVLGDKMTGQIYTPDDLEVFEILASQAALAIENAQFYDEAKEMQKQIAQAEKMATIGTMADGLSHQINNRFYALSLIAGDSIDTIKMTDTSQCSPEVKEMIQQINHALERVQANVMQGAEVVKGLLKYSRTGDENFEALSLDQVIDGTLEMVQYKVRLSEIDLVRDYPKDLPRIKGNLTQLQEAFFNFIDNAYDAIVERHTMLKEEGYRGRINISASPKNNMLEIIIEDNGMGIKDHDDKKVFTPFFTTKTSSRRGTGLGLYVIKKIITDAHKGKITFESGYKVGTRFILELPIAK